MPTPLGSLLLRTRKSAGLTQEALAERAGVSVNTISNLEAGRLHIPRQATLDLLATTLSAALSLAPAEQAELRRALIAAGDATRAHRSVAGTEVSAPIMLPAGTLTFLACAFPPGPASHPGLAAQLQRIVPDNHGRLVDPPEAQDGAVCVFVHAGDALAAACALQQATVGATIPDADLPVCLALHTGRAEPGAGAYAGPSRRRAVRLALLGHAGQILLSQPVRDLVEGTLPEGLRLHALGRHSLSAVERPLPISQLLRAGSPSVFPPLRPAQARPTNLPLQPTSFIGREWEQVTVGELLAQAPLVTLVGAGGCGKTRLALQVAAELLEGYSDGTWLVELAALSGPGPGGVSPVPMAVAAALSLREEPSRPLLATLLDALGSRHLLLVLDNCEHLLAACAELAAALLRGCPHLRLLATSRERLGIRGETSYRVPSLSTPDPSLHPAAVALAAYEGVQLFVERARAANSDFALTEEQAGAVARICIGLDGIPLAIELAAARVGSLPVAAIAARLDRSIELLTGGPRDVLPRHQTLRATLDWSWELLGEGERILLRRLSVFAGGWPIGAAVAVCGGDGLEGWAVPEVLDGLAARSLVGLDEAAVGARYRLLETVRQYAEEHLAADALEVVVVRDRHLGWCVALAEEAEPQLKGPDQQAWLVRLEREHGNLRAALGWARGRGESERGLRLALALGRFWYTRGYLSEGRGWLERALDGSREVPAGLRATALKGAGSLALLQGEYGQAAALYEEALALFRALGDGQGVAGSLTNLGIVADRQGNYAQAAALFEAAVVLARERGDTLQIAKTLGNLAAACGRQGDTEREEALLSEALALFRALGDRQSIAIALDNLGLVAFRQGHQGRAAAWHDEALALFRALGDRHGIVTSLTNLGGVALALGDHGRAAELLEEGLLLARDIGAMDELAGILECLAWVAAARGQPHRAVQLGGAAEALLHALGIPLMPEQRAGHDQAVQAMRVDLGEEAFAVAWVQGGSLFIEQAVAIALEERTEA